MLYKWSATPLPSLPPSPPSPHVPHAPLSPQSPFHHLVAASLVRPDVLDEALLFEACDVAVDCTLRDACFRGKLHG